MSEPTGSSLQAQRDYALVQMEDLKRRGRQLREALAAEPAHAPSLSAVRSWQQACASAIHQLAGGSKAHWLSRAYSGALLVRSADGEAIVEADVLTIADRILDILEQASRSLLQMDEVAVASSAAAPPRRRFEFVHNPQLRPVLEQAFVGSGDALAAGNFALSLITSCAVIEAIITDALEYCGSRIADCGLDCGLESGLESALESGFNDSTTPAIRNPKSALTGLSFEARIAEAEREGLIRRGCARLPPVARGYRLLPGADEAVSERDATLARQVLHVVMRDLDPGR